MGPDLGESGGRPRGAGGGVGAGEAPAYEPLFIRASGRQATFLSASASPPFQLLISASPSVFMTQILLHYRRHS
jgi:hypothetical protein